ncbi:helix-turn-helix domain-containing protein, partial [Enorma phocaeensis]
MSRYHHLSIEEREGIMCLRRGHAGVGEIARRLHHSKSTVSRELRRNSCRSGAPGEFYRASTAQRRYGERRAACRRRRKLDDPGLRSLVQRHIIEDRWSPAQIAGRIRLETGRAAASTATIYRAIGDRRLDTPALAGTARGMASRLRLICFNI